MCAIRSDDFVFETHAVSIRNDEATNWLASCLLKMNMMHSYRHLLLHEMNNVRWRRRCCCCTSNWQASLTVTLARSLSARPQQFSMANCGRKLTNVSELLQYELMGCDLIGLMSARAYTQPRRQSLMSDWHCALRTLGVAIAYKTQLDPFEHCSILNSTSFVKIMMRRRRRR